MLDEFYSIIDSQVKDEELKLALKKYVEYLIENDLPVIFDLVHFGDRLNINIRKLVSMIYLPKYFYYSFELPKRRGGFRIIDKPYPSLHIIQKWILQQILEKLPISDYAHGFVKGKSIISNANCHLNQEVLLKMDLKDFFPSIKINRIISLFEYNGYPHHIAYYFAALCCYEQRLPQGACTSPYLSNLVAYKLDKRLGKLAESMNINYTRYADDMTFSGKKISSNIIDIITEIIQEEGFFLNDKKTILIKGLKRKKIVTGLSVSGTEIKLPKETKRELRQEAFFLRKYGLKNHLEKNHFFDPLYKERIIGKLNFWLQVEPKNSFAQEILQDLENSN